MESADRELVVDPEAAGERLDVLPGGRGRLARRGAAADRRRARAGRRRRAAQAPRRRRRRARDGAAPRPPRSSRRCRDAPFTVAYEDEHLLVVDKPAGVVVHPARGHRGGTLAQALAGRVAGGDDPEPRRDRAPARPRHLRAARGGAHRGGPRGAEGAAAGARDHARVPRARRGPPGGPGRHDRRAARARPARAHAHVDRHRRAARRGHALRDRARATRATRSCACGSRRAARTRSAPT